MFGRPGVLTRSRKEAPEGVLYLPVKQASRSNDIHLSLDPLDSMGSVHAYLDKSP